MIGSGEGAAAGAMLMGEHSTAAGQKNKETWFASYFVPSTKK
jgi:hypothetical protein